MGHHLLARTFSAKQTNYAGSVACTSHCPEERQSDNSKSSNWRIKMDRHRGRRSSYQHIFHTSHFHSSSTQQHWKSPTRCWESFQSTKYWWELTRIQNWHARVGNAVPDCEMSAGNEERAKNTWTAAAPPQEEMYTRKESDTRQWAISQVENN